MEKCGMTCTKYLLFFFNSIFALSGVAIIAAGACVLKDADTFSNFMETSVLAPPVILTIVGIIVFLISFMGCWGAIKENYRMLMVFGLCLFIIFVVELAVGITAAVNRETFRDQLRKIMQDSKANYGNPTSKDRKVWAQIQSKLQCCGVDGPSDWTMGGMYPESCCRGYDSAAASSDRLCGPSKELVYQQGCFSKLSDKIREAFLIVMGVGMGVAIIEGAGIVLACLLAAHIKKESGTDED